MKCPHCERELLQMGFTMMDYNHHGDKTVKIWFYCMKCKVKFYWKSVFHTSELRDERI